MTQLILLQLELRIPRKVIALGYARKHCLLRDREEEKRIEPSQGM